ncbi:MAG: hypothetical protein ACFCD0_12455 [Gemmataceae bacterium]
MPSSTCLYCRQEMNETALELGSCNHCGERVGGEFMAELPLEKRTEFVEAEARPHSYPQSLLVDMPLITEGLERFPHDRDDGIFYTCLNPYCATTLGSFPDDVELLARCPACRCPAKIPARSEFDFDVPPEAFLASPANMQTLPFSPDLFKIKLRSVDLGSLLTLGLVFAFPGTVMGYLWSLGEVDEGLQRWITMLVGTILGFLVGLLLYLPMRSQERRRGNLAEVEGLREAAEQGNSPLLIAGIQHENRTIRVACAKALLDHPELAKSAVPALIDVLWGRPAQYASGHKEAGTELMCQHCGTRLFFWNRAKSNWVVGTNFCFPCWRSLRRDPEVIMAEMLPPEGWAARALGLCGSEGIQAVPALMAIIDTTNVPSVYGEAVNAVEQIRGQSFHYGEDEESESDNNPNFYAE